MGAVYILGQTTVYSQFPVKIANAVESIRVVGLSKRDQRNLERGYYENLVSVNRNSRLWEAYAGRPDDWNKAPKGVYIPTGDLRGTELAPNLEYQFKGVEVRTNQWGMRDQHYELKKPENTIRIALLGASYVFGSGVPNTENFESVLEEMLNNKKENKWKIEILNFATSGRTAVRQTAILEYKVFPFAPDIVLYVGHKGDARRVAASVAKRVIYDFDILFPGLRKIVEQANVNKDMDLETIENRLSPYGQQILQWAYGRIVKECRTRGIKPIYILLPMTYERFKKVDTEQDINMARSAGFTTIDLREVYNLQDPESLYIATWDKHPNAEGHRLIAEHLYRVFTDTKSHIFMQQPRDRLLFSDQQDSSKPEIGEN
jgi:hypothetical protein